MQKGQGAAKPLTSALVRSLHRHSLGFLRVILFGPVFIFKGLAVRILTFAGV